jgi:hypothetical protein
MFIAAMKYVIKPFLPFTVSYKFNCPPETVRQQINTLFTERSSIFKSPNLRGKFLDASQFFIAPKYGFMVNGVGGAIDGVSLKGTVYPTKEGNTNLEVTLKPNYGLGIFFLLMGCVGFYLLFASLTAEKDNLSLFYTGLCILLIGLPFMRGIISLSTYSLHSDFEEYMKIR